MMKFFILDAAPVKRYAVSSENRDERKGAAMVSWTTVAVLALVGALSVACCAAVARAFFLPRADRVAYRMAGVWAAVFVVTLVACLMAKDALGLQAAVVVAAGACVLAFSLCPLFARWQRTREMAAAVAYLQLHRPGARTVEGESEPAPTPDPSGWKSDLDSRCAQLARAYDLTRREEDVLRLLMEGMTFVQVADELVVSLNTIKSHVRRIYAKLGVSGKQDLLEKVSVS